MAGPLHSNVTVKVIGSMTYGEYIKLLVLHNIMSFCHYVYGMQILNYSD